MYIFTDIYVGVLLKLNLFRKVSFLLLLLEKQEKYSVDILICQNQFALCHFESLGD
jgi:hypothetical protein